MTFQSAQTNFKGQSGWNDLLPGALDLGAARLPAKTRRRVPSASVLSATPVSPSAVPPLASSTARPTARPPVARPPVARPPVARSSARPPTDTAPGADTAPTPTSTASATPGATPGATASTTSTASTASTDPSVKEARDRILQGVRDLAARPSQLDAKNIAQSLERIEKALPSLEAPLPFIEQVLAAADNKAEAKALLVEYSLTHHNVTIWTVPLRRLIENAN